MATLVKVKKWGSSVAVLIPRGFAKERGVEVGTVLDLESVRILASKQCRYKLSELLARYKPEHGHGEWELGEPVGREVW